ncbi:MAG: YbaB/EbfC family nucleoid-associated protein [Magnetococcales bacterium]|nr:YbaB/EbfC family nucleoid-associated protein [Magnetococcales bacterium]
MKGFGGNAGSNAGGMGNMLKQVQQMQAQMAKMQEEVAITQVTGQSGGGMVTVVMSGNHEVQKVTIEASVVNASDIELLEDLVAAACNDANKKVRDMTQQRMSSLTGGLNIPGLNLPF